MIAAYGFVSQCLPFYGLKTWVLAAFLPLIVQISKKRVGVHPPQEFQKRRLTFDSLAEIAPVVFESFSPGTTSLPDACLFLGHEHPLLQQLNVPCYVWEKKAASLGGVSAKVDFSTWRCLHTAIRGHRLVESTPRDIGFCSVRDRDTIVATLGDQPVWTLRGLVHRVSVEPPCLNADELLYSHFSPERWLGLLPLLHFLRSVTSDIDWQAPPLKACIVFDDPNLHALTYGYLDFRRLVEDAKARRYHVSMATVPLDAWYVSSEAARLFRENSQYISLTTHGSDHTKNELVNSNGNGLLRLVQALRRTEVLERKTLLEVSRFMIAPHGACLEATMDIMLKLGYEGSGIPTYSLLEWNPGKQWPADFGLGNVLWMGAGFPVVYRFGLVSNETKIRLSAFLGQPIVPYGHHWDCSSGLDLLGSIADAVNNAGGCWGNMQSIMRSNYKTKANGDLLQIQMCSRRIQVHIPEDTTFVSVDRPWMMEADQEYLAYSSSDGRSASLLSGSSTDPIEVTPGSELILRALPKEQLHYRTLTAPPPRIWPVVRRVLAEARDRVKPILGR
jgi:hypothetical protein